jgi:hypothetical protein
VSDPSDARFSYTMKQLREMYREAHDGIGIPGREEWGALIVTSILADTIAAREALPAPSIVFGEDLPPDAVVAPSFHDFAAPVSEEEGSEGRAAAECFCDPDDEAAETEHIGCACCGAAPGKACAHRAPAPPPSTGDAPGPSEECHVEGCGWRWPRGSGLGCPQHPSPRAQTGTDEGRGVTDADLRALVAEGRKAGRAEAAAILMTQEADSILDDLTASMPIGDTGDYSAEWEREKVLALFDATGSAALSLIDRLDGAYWEATARAEDALRSAALRREERDPRLAALEEAARVVDGLAAHTSREDEEQRAWLYAYAKAAAAIRALSSPATNPEVKP